MIYPGTRAAQRSHEFASPDALKGFREQKTLLAAVVLLVGDWFPGRVCFMRSAFNEETNNVEVQEEMKGSRKLCASHFCGTAFPRCHHFVSRHRQRLSDPSHGDRHQSHTPEYMPKVLLPVAVVDSPVEGNMIGDKSFPKKL